jgi:hypothetical protein
MRYANILSDAISKSGLSYSQISMKCEQKGMKISRGYLSQLCTSTKPPASDEMNKVLVEVLGKSSGLTYEEITYAKYYEILSPEVFKIILSRGLRQCEQLKTS